MSLSQLGDQQRVLLDCWFPGAHVLRDLSWGLVERAVLELQHEGARYVVKAGGPSDHHMGREIFAHLHWLEPWTSRAVAPMMARHDLAANLLVTRWQPGHLVLDTAAAAEPDTFEQAGRLLALLHDQPGECDPGYEERANRKTLDWLDHPHRIDVETEGLLRRTVKSWPTEPVALVPTHGDWQPRNWLVDHGEVSVIDFGRAELRPALSDFARLAAQDFRRDPRLEEAFLAGYGWDPREPVAWWRQQVREAIGTAVWAHQVGDETFEAQGHRMIADVLGDRSVGDPDPDRTSGHGDTPP